MCRESGKLPLFRAPEEKARILRELTEKVFPKFEDGTLRPVVWRVLPITEAEEAHAILERNENIGKVVLRV